MNDKHDAPNSFKDELLEQNGIKKKVFEEEYRRHIREQIERKDRSWFDIIIRVLVWMIAIPLLLMLIPHINYAFLSFAKLVFGAPVPWESPDPYMNFSTLGPREWLLQIFFLGLAVTAIFFLLKKLNYIQNVYQIIFGVVGIVASIYFINYCIGSFGTSSETGNSIPNEPAAYTAFVSMLFTFLPIAILALIVGGLVAWIQGKSTQHLSRSDQSRDFHVNDVFDRSNKELVHMRWINFVLWIAALASIALQIGRGGFGPDITAPEMILFQAAPILLLAAIVSSILLAVRSASYKRTLSKDELNQRLDRLEAMFERFLEQQESRNPASQRPENDGENTRREPDL